MMMRREAISCVLLLVVVGRITAFSGEVRRGAVPDQSVQEQCRKQDVDIPADSPARRRLFKSISFAPLVVPFTTRAVMMKNSEETSTFKAGEAMGAKDALTRFRNAKKDLQYLVDNYDQIVANGGGDNVRRYLGTVGVSSNLYGIDKVMKELQEEANDIVEYTENMTEFDSALRAADTACYSANFVEFSAAKTKPEKFFKDALYDIGNMMKAMDIMSAELSM